MSTMSKRMSIEEHVFGYGVYLIGQHPDCDIVLVDPAVSGHHARLLFDASGLRVEDMESRKGTFLDGQRIDAPRVIRAGTLKIGSRKVIVVVDESTRFERTESARLRVAVLHAKRSSTHATPFSAAPGLATKTSPVMPSGVTVDGNGDDTQATIPRDSPTPTASAGETMDADSRKPLSVGALVELCGRRANKRLLCLKSISRLGGVYFFMDQHSNGTSLCVTAECLSRYLQEHSARVVSNAPA